MSISTMLGGVEHPGEHPQMIDVMCRLNWEGSHGPLLVLQVVLSWSSNRGNGPGSGLGWWSRSLGLWPWSHGGGPSPGRWVSLPLVSWRWSRSLGLSLGLPLGLSLGLPLCLTPAPDPCPIPVLSFPVSSSYQETWEDEIKIFVVAGGMHMCRLDA